MVLKLANNTGSLQQIMFCDGTCKNVEPGKEEVIDLGSVYSEEILRLGKFFKIEEVVPIKKEPFRPTKIETRVADKNDGGNE
jgi:ABC-type hemin transport system substrate-binding protein